MKNSLIIIIVLIFFSCKEEKTIINDKVETSNELLKANNEEIIDQSIDITQKVEEECIFDQSSQTDDFLKGIKELEGYVWFDEKKKAELVLNDHWSLSIKRGGCDHFELSVEFLYDRVLDFEENKKEILGKIIWITTILNDEFESEKIKKVIDENRMTFTKDENFIFGHFMDSEIYEMYTFRFQIEKRSTAFGVSFHLD